MLVDAFIFNNEIDILKARLDYLENHIDYFVIVESNTTFTGKSKNLILKNLIKEKFYHLKNKILIYENRLKVLSKEDLLINNKRIFKKDSPSFETILKMNQIIKYKKEIALNETFQRELLSLAINKFIKYQDAIIIISDVDEIPNISFLINLNKIEEDKIFYADMKQYIYSTKFFLMEKWIGSVAFRKSILNKYSIYYLRFMVKHENTYLIPHKIISNSGWHLTSFGSAEMIESKITSWGHWELNTFLNKRFLLYRIKRCFDIFGRNKKILYLDKNLDLPKLISKNFLSNKYIKEFIKPNLFDFIFNRIIILFDKFIRQITLAFEKK